MTSTTFAPTPVDGTALRARDLTLSYDGRRVVEHLDLDVPAGRITVVVGPNGCGKSTLLRGLARLLRPTEGSVHLASDGAHDDVWSLRPKGFARHVALLPQSPPVPEGITVVDLVGRGRHPHRKLVRRWSRADDEAVTRAMRATGTIELAERPVDELSGGQRQRVWIALTLAQETDVVLLDEPTTYLDLAHQVDVLDLLRDLNRSRGTTVVMVLHDLNLAARYADHVVALRDGRLVGSGAPADLVDEEFVAQVFGLRSRVITDPVTGSPLVVPTSTHHQSGATS
ncbi:ABC transporter [Terrabacter sp. Root85]|uniref:ABC transporter ATP-binding protein n=1 Tax=Terrabacter sp. Root85 TaxID=1736603 RepID=UPI0006FECFE9|nr:ABC transporter ATP-binding protein [Terrabacter sp. Root85]KRC85277.1 ABC transporter [Terrabacter sp. Root85]